jgi:hypothetical protein
MEDLYFKVEAEKLIFCLLEMDGLKRAEKLNITDKEYESKRAAKKWKKNILKIIDPSVCNHPKAKEAVEKLSKFYNSMID